MGHDTVMPPGMYRNEPFLMQQHFHSSPSEENNVEPQRGLIKAEDALNGELNENRRAAFDRVQVNVGDIGAKYKDMFKLLRQKGCKKIVQAWLRRAHHQKQSLYPYNGGSDAESHPDYDPDNRGKHTAPPYWPSQDDWRNPEGSGCRHKEPDHQKKHGQSFAQAYSGESRY